MTEAPDPAAAVRAGVPPQGMTRAQWRRQQAQGAADAVAASDPLPLRRRSRIAAVDPESRKVPAPAVTIGEDSVAADAVPSAFTAASLPDAARLPGAAPKRDCTDDEFARAAALFSFSAPSRRRMATSPASAASAADDGAAGAVGNARRGRVLVARAATASVSVAVMGVVGLLALGTTGPAALAATAGTADIQQSVDLTTEEEEDIQAFVTPSDTATVPLERNESYDVASMADLAADAGVTKFTNTWINDPNAPVQWPFEVGVPITAGYGSSSYLATFSTAHNGVDFTPGEGAEIHAVAAGTVRIATEAGGGYGVTVVIDHIIDGELISTRYAHMQYGSLRVAEGDTVTAGQVIGSVGSTGRSTGPHLHLEVLLGGTEYTDPLAWLEAHT